MTEPLGDAVYHVVRFWTDLTNTFEHGKCWACKAYMFHHITCVAIAPPPYRYLKAL